MDLIMPSTTPQQTDERMTSSNISTTDSNSVILNSDSKSGSSSSVIPVSNDKETTRPRICLPILTRYERTSVIGMRIEQLRRGAPPYVDIPTPPDGGGIGTSRDITVREIALRELQERRLPFAIHRRLPDGTRERWLLSELLSLD